MPILLFYVPVCLLVAVYSSFPNHVLFLGFSSVERCKRDECSSRVSGIICLFFLGCFHNLCQRFKNTKTPQRAFCLAGFSTL